MDEACPLKVRRYLAYGLPVILGYRDTDLDATDAWWLLGLPNTEANVATSLPRIESFVNSVRGRRIPRDEVEPLISAAAKEAARLAFSRRSSRRPASIPAVPERRRCLSIRQNTRGWTRGQS